MAGHGLGQQALVGGYIVLGLALISTLGLAGLLLARWLDRRTVVAQLLSALVIGTLSFQGVHFFEHLLQIGYWFLHPAYPSWMTPWGQAAADGLGALLAGHHATMATGMELLHLVGNWITFVGLIAMYVTSRSWRIWGPKMRAIWFAFWLQRIPVLEHVSLTSTYLLVGRPIGMSTLLGASFYLGEPWASSIRLWWHFLINLAVMGAFVLAVREFHGPGCSHHSAGELTKYRSTGTRG